MSLIINNTEIETVIARILHKNGTTTDIELDEVWCNGAQAYISTIFVPRPVMEPADLYYNEETQGITITGYDPAAMTMSGDAEGLTAGDYSVTYSLNKGYAWEDGSEDPVIFDWSIKRKLIATPTVTGAFTFNTANQTCTVSGVDTNWMTQSGTVTASAAGTYTVSWTLVDTANTCWSDGADGAKSGSWSIAKRVIAIPSLTNTSRPTTGNAVSPTFNNENATYITRTGTSSASSVGTWYVYWNLKYPASTTWTDGTTAQKSGTWSTYGGTINFVISYGNYADGTLSCTYGTTIYNKFKTSQQVLSSNYSDRYVNGYCPDTSTFNIGYVKTNYSSSSSSKCKNYSSTGAVITNGARYYS